MNTKIISAIAFKLLAIYLMASVLVSVSYIFSMFLSAWLECFSQEIEYVWPSIIILVTIIFSIIIARDLWKLGDGVLSQTRQQSHRSSPWYAGHSQR